MSAHTTASYILHTYYVLWCPRVSGESCTAAMAAVVCIVYIQMYIQGRVTWHRGIGDRLAAAADPDETEKRLEKWMQSS